MTKLERTKIIDRYLSNEMEDNERIGFERLLSEEDLSSNNEQSLRKEMKLQQEIENAIRERGLREMLQKEEARIRHRLKVKKVTVWSLCGGSVITAIAAVLLLLLVVTPTVHIMQDYSTQYISQIEVSSIRGGNVQADALNEAILLMKQDEWAQASVIIDNIFNQTEDSEEEQVIEMHNEAEWLKAIYLMHEGEEDAATTLLKKIANSNSYYSAKAAEVLDKLK